MLICAPLFVTGCILVDGATSPGPSTSNSKPCDIVICHTKPHTFLQLPDGLLPEETQKRIISEAARVLTLDQRLRTEFDHSRNRHMLYLRREWAATNDSTTASSLQLAFVEDGLFPHVGFIAWHSGGSAHIGACRIEARKQVLREVLPVDTSFLEELSPESASAVLQTDADAAHSLGHWQGPRQRASNSNREVFYAHAKNKSSQNTPPCSPGKEHGRPRNAARPTPGTATSASSATNTISGRIIGGHTKHISHHTHPLRRAGCSW